MDPVGMRGDLEDTHLAVENIEGRTGRSKGALRCCSIARAGDVRQRARLPRPVVEDTEI